MSLWSTSKPSAFANKESTSTNKIVMIGHVFGRVQGVGFRYFVKREALKHGLNGYAYNLPDGTVDVLLSGEKAAVHAVQILVNTGPITSRVDTVDWSENNSKRVEAGFRTG